MIDDSDLNTRRAAYADTIRALGRRERGFGFIACLVGALLLIWGRMVSGAPDWAVAAGLVTIAAGWLLFVYVILRRTRYVRAHPFDPQS
jgi:ABC-type Fe3+-siderophore transport system permease subunit